LNRLARLNSWHPYGGNNQGIDDGDELIDAEFPVSSAASEEDI